MRKTISRILAAGLFVVILLGLYFLQSSVSQAGASAIEYNEYKRHYAMITDGADTDTDFWNSVYDSACEMGKEKDVYVERFGNKLSADYDRNQLLKMAIQASVDGIIVAADDSDETVELIDSAVENGIPVVTVLRDCSASSRQCYVGINNYNIGQEYGEQIKDMMAKQPDTIENIVVISSRNSEADSSENLVLLGIRETLSKFIKNKKLTVESGHVTSKGEFATEEYIRDLFLDHQNIPDVIICLDAVSTSCAYQAAVDYNMVGDVQILGFYDSEAILSAVGKNIVVSTLSLDTAQMGRYCIEAMEDYFDTGYTNGYMDVDTKVIDPEEASNLLIKK